MKDNFLTKLVSIIALLAITGVVSSIFHFNEQQALIAFVIGLIMLIYFDRK